MIRPPEACAPRRIPAWKLILAIIRGYSPRNEVVVSGEINPRRSRWPVDLACGEALKIDAPDELGYLVRCAPYDNGDPLDVATIITVKLSASSLGRRLLLPADSLERRTLVFSSPRPRSRMPSEFNFTWNVPNISCILILADCSNHVWDLPEPG